MHIIVDCEASGPCPGHGELVRFAAVSLCGKEWRSETISPDFDAKYSDAAYASFGYSRLQHCNDFFLARTHGLAYEMVEFNDWLGEGKHQFWSDNPAFDWQWINKAFHDVGLANPFGWSARRIGDLYAGFNGNWKDHSRWKRFRKTPHTHDPLDDARGNAEALRHILEKFK